MLAVLAACANATSSVLQRKANREVPREKNLSLRLIWSLPTSPTSEAVGGIQRPRWPTAPNADRT